MRNKFLILLFIISAIQLLLNFPNLKLEGEAFSIWLVATVVIISLIIVPLWGLNVAVHYKELKKSKAPKPFKIQIKQLAITNILADLIFFLPIKIMDIKKLQGKNLWLEWDIRWGPNGVTVAKVEDVVKYEKSFIFLLKLSSPIEKSEMVLFRPYTNKLNRYHLGKIIGEIFVFKGKENYSNLNSDDIVTIADIVLY